MSDKPIPDASTPDQVAVENTTAQAVAAPANEAATRIGSDTDGSPAAEGDAQAGGGARSTAVLTQSPTPQATPDTPPATPNSDGSAPFAALLDASRARGTARPGTADRQPAAWPRVPSASSQPFASSMPLPPMPPPLPPAPKRWQYVARPPGVLPAAALAGIVGATVIPVDRPGIGWLIAGTAVTGALCAVDYRARSRGTENTPAESAPTAATSPAPAHITTSEAHESTEPSAETASAEVETSEVNNAEKDRSIRKDTAAQPDSDAATLGEVASAPPATVDVERSEKAATQIDSAEAGAGTAKRPPANTATGSGEPGLRFGTAAATRETPPEEAASPPASIRDRVWWAAAAMLLLGVGTVRAAGWLFALCVIAACVAGSLAVLGRRSVRGIVHDVFAVPLASFGAVPWAFSGLRESRSVGTSSVRRYGVSVAATAALLVVFVPLLGGADATFAELLNGLVPTVDAPAAWQWIFLFVLVTMGVLGALYLLAGPPPRAADSVRPDRLWSRSEWMLPVGALTVLFAVFVGAQFVALFGGDDYVQRTAGLTYAEYARSGFWQLSAVSVLTLAVILAVLRWSVQETAADRRSLRILLSAVSVLALVIVCSALGRMWTYQQAYGFTVLRLLVTTCELWVGLVYVLVLVAIARLRWTWVPRAAIGTALATLIALAVVNPEHLVAERNIDRWHTSKRLDANYLSGLSSDILPALDGLGDSYLRAEIEDAVRHDLDDDDWWSWNWSRSAAR